MADFECIVAGVSAVLKERRLLRLSDGSDLTSKIPDVEGLIKVIALTRALISWKLNPSEITLLKEAANLSGRGLAEAMDVPPETVSRWEHGQPMGAHAEKCFRHLICVILHDRIRSVPFDSATIAHMKIQTVQGGRHKLRPLAFKRGIFQDPNSAETFEAWSPEARV